MLWKYQHSNYSIVKITAVAVDGLSATVDIVSHMVGAEPLVAKTLVSLAAVGAQLSGSAANCTTRWAFSLYNNVDGWPSSIAFYRNRLCYGGPGTNFVASWIGDYDNFGLLDGPLVTAETGINKPLALNKLDTIRWMIESSVLLVGGARLEAAIFEQTPQQVFSATNIKADSITEYGSRRLAPMRAGDAVLFLERGGRKLRELRADNGRFAVEDLTVLAEHVLAKRVKSAAFAQIEENSVRAVMEDGTIAALTYNRERGVIAWSRFELGGAASGSPNHAVVEDVAVIASPDEKRDDAWYVVKRTIDGATVYYLEIEENPRLHETAQKDAFFVDCGITYSGAPASSFSGLDHLEGQTVSVLADGAPAGLFEVSGGNLTIDYPASTLQIGLPTKSVLAPMRPETGTKEDTSQGRLKAYAEVVIRVDQSRGGAVGPSETQADNLPYPLLETPFDTAPPLFTGDVKVVYPGGWTSDADLYIVQTEPLPLTVVAIMPELEGESA